MGGTGQEKGRERGEESISHTSKHRSADGRSSQSVGTHLDLISGYLIIDGLQVLPRQVLLVVDTSVHPDVVLL